MIYKDAVAPQNRGQDVRIYMCTFACHALMVPALLRRPREGVQGPEYQLDAVELAEI